MIRMSEIAAVARKTLSNGMIALRPTGGQLWDPAWAIATGFVALLAGRTLFVDGASLAAVALLAVLVCGAVWAALIYRRILAPPVSSGLLADSLRLMGAGVLFCVAVGLAVFIAALFLILFALALVVGSGYDPSLAGPENVAGSREALRASGAIWILYAALTCVIGATVWFAARLFLTGAATVAEGRVMVFQGWARTKGAGLMIGVLSLGLVGVPFLALEGLGAGLLGVFALEPGGLIAALWPAPSAGGRGSMAAALIGAVSGAAAFFIAHVLAATLYQHLAGRVTA